MANHRNIALLIPTYNVASQIQAVLEKLSPEIQSLFAKIYFIDNNSSDGTLAVVKDWAERQRECAIEIYQNKINVYLGGSTKVGFDMAIQEGYDYLICMHSDGQADPQDLWKFRDSLEEGDFDFILGSRFLPDSTATQYSKLRYVFNLAFAYLQQSLLKTRVYDIGAFIGFNLKTIAQLPYQKIPSDMGYHPYLILVASQMNKPLSFKEFGIYWGQVETTNVNVWKYGLIHLIRIAKLHLGINPENCQYEAIQTTRIR